MSVIFEELYFDKENKFRVLKTDGFNIQKYNLNSYKIEQIFNAYNKKIGEMIRFRDNFNFIIENSKYILEIENIEGWLIINDIRKKEC